MSYFSVVGATVAMCISGIVWILRILHKNQQLETEKERRRINDEAKGKINSTSLDDLVQDSLRRRAGRESAKTGKNTNH